MTERQYQAWLEWQRREWNKPSRTDYYLMQVFCGQLQKMPTSWPKIRFNFSAPDQDSSGLTVEQATEIAKQRAFARAGPPAIIRKKLPDGTIIEVSNNGGY